MAIIKKEPTKISVIEPNNIVMPIHIYYHIGAIDNDYKSIVDDQIKLLESTGLLNKADRIFYSIVGKQDISLPAKFECIYKNTDFTVAELPMINLLHEHSKTNDFKCLYFHTKGSSSDYQKHIKINQKSWRKYMEYFCIEKWESNISLLNKFDTIGTSLIFANDSWYQNHYAGNFWWANSSYIKTLSSVYDNTSKGRYKAEMWLLSNRNVNAFNWHKRDSKQTFGMEYYSPFHYRERTR
jgi:hypothetical protein